MKCEPGCPRRFGSHRIILNTGTGQQLKSRVAADDVWVPEHFYIEVAGVFRRMQLHYAITATNAGEAFTELIALRANRAQVKTLLPAAWALRANITVADAVYVVLAQQLGAPLVTGDNRLGRALLRDPSEEFRSSAQSANTREALAVELGDK